MKMTLPKGGSGRHCMTFEPNEISEVEVAAHPDFLMIRVWLTNGESYFISTEGCIVNTKGDALTKDNFGEYMKNFNMEEKISE